MTTGWEEGSSLETGRKKGNTQSGSCRKEQACWCDVKHKRKLTRKRTQEHEGNEQRVPGKAKAIIRGFPLAGGPNDSPHKAAGGETSERREESEQKPTLSLRGAKGEILVRR